MHRINSKCQGDWDCCSSLKINPWQGYAVFSTMNFQEYELGQKMIGRENKEYTFCIHSILHVICNKNQQLNNKLKSSSTEIR